MIQLSFTNSEFVQKRRITRKERFLEKMEKLVPWRRLIDVIEPHYPKRGNGRPPYPLEIMVRIYCLQQWYSLSDEGMEDVLYEIASMRLFAGLLLDRPITDRTTFGMNVHIGVDARTGLTHSLTTTAANEHDLNQAEELLHGGKGFIFGDAGYRGAEQRPELQDVFAEWFIAENPSRIKELKKHLRKNRDALKLEYDKASIRAFVEHPFRIIKYQFGFVKAVYKEFKKNDNKLATLFALANIVRLGQLIRA